MARARGLTTTRLANSGIYFYGDDYHTRRSKPDLWPPGTPFGADLFSLSLAAPSSSTHPRMQARSWWRSGRVHTFGCSGCPIAIGYIAGGFEKISRAMYASTCPLTPFRDALGREGSPSSIPSVPYTLRTTVHTLCLPSQSPGRWGTAIYGAFT